MRKTKFKVAPASDPAGEVQDLMVLPEMESVADLDYTRSAPAEWPADYRRNWQQLQIAARNKMQWRVYALRLRAELKRRREEEARLKWAIKELIGALPTRRDWLSPDAEKVLREYLAGPRKAAPPIGRN